MDAAPLLCPTCHQPVSAGWYFCANCSKELNVKPVKISVPMQGLIFAVSILLPPLGLWPGIKYLNSAGQDAKLVGTIAIVLTLISSILTLWLTFHYLQSYLSIYSGLVLGNR